MTCINKVMATFLHSRVQSLLYNNGLGQVSLWNAPDYAEDVENGLASTIPPISDKSIECGMLPRVIKTLVDCCCAMSKLIKFIHLIADSLLDSFGCINSLPYLSSFLIATN